MAKFVTGKVLEDVVYQIIWNAENQLMIVSPYIKLDDYFKKLFEKHLNNPRIHILIVFGKNELKVSNSLRKCDFDFFKQFLNVSIVYVPNLHGKYYGNEQTGIITSINLYDYSFKNNIEFGVYTELNLLNRFTDNADMKAWDACDEMANEGEAIFVKRPVFEKSLLSPILGKKYIKSDIEHDTTDQFYSLRSTKTNIKKLREFPNEKFLGSDDSKMPSRDEVDRNNIGYCIRTGEKIDFNIDKPYSFEAWKSWNRFKNPHFKEKYCHKTGRPSYGKTSKDRPIL